MVSITSRRGKKSEWSWRRRKKKKKKKRGRRKKEGKTDSC